MRLESAGRAKRRRRFGFTVR